MFDQVARSVARFGSILCNLTRRPRQSGSRSNPCCATGDNAMTNAKHAIPVKGVNQLATPEQSRRKFLTAAAGAAFSFTIVPRHVLGGPGQTPPSERVNLAGVGAGGMGGGDIATFKKLGANIVALCDV